MMKKQTIAKISAGIALISLLFSGCKQETPANEGFFEKIPDNNVQVTMPQVANPTQPTQKQTSIALNLPEEFEALTPEAGPEQYDSLYSNGQMGIGVSRKKKPEFGTLEDYAKREADYYRTEALQKDGFWTISYEDTQANEPQTLVTVYYETEECYWQVQGFCPSQSYELYQDQIWQYITGAQIVEN